MGNVTNISNEDLDVPLLRRTVKAGETADADDALLDPAAFSWAADRWLVNGERQAQQPAEQVSEEPSTPEPTAAVDETQE